MLKPNHPSRKSALSNYAVASALCAALLSSSTSFAEPFANSTFNQFDSAPEPSFLPVEEAFKLAASTKDDQLVVHWDIAPGYFLYQHSLKVESDENEQSIDITRQFSDSPALRKSDPYFGQVGIYYHRAELSHQAQQPLEELTISYQGCADTGLCYPTQKTTLKVND